MTDHTMAGQERTAAHVVSSWGRVTWVVVLVSVALSLLILTFAWPSSRAEMSGQTIAVTGEAVHHRVRCRWEPGRGRRPGEGR